MAGLKRKDGPKAAIVHASPSQKKQKLAKEGKPTKSKAKPVGADMPESDTTEDDLDAFGGFDESESDGGAEVDDNKSESKKAKSATPKSDGDKNLKRMRPLSMILDGFRRLTSAQLKRPPPSHTPNSEPWPKNERWPSRMPIRFNVRRRSGNAYAASHMFHWRSAKHW